MDATGGEVTLWQQMLERPNFWVEGSVPLRTAEKLAHAWKTINKISSPNQGRGKPFSGARGTTAPISLKIIGASSGISNQPSTNTTLGIYHEEKQKNKNHDYQKQEQQTNKMLDAMYWSEKKTNEILSLWYCTYSSLINISLIWRKKNTYDYTTRVLKQASILEIQKWKKTLTLKCSTSNNISEYLTLQLILTYLQTKNKEKSTTENMKTYVYLLPLPKKTTL